MIGSSSRRWVAAGVVGVAIVVLGVVALLASSGGDGSGDTDCAAFRVTPDLWAKADYDRRIQLQRGLLDCKTLSDKPDTEVVATLGPPDRNGAAELDYYLPYGAGSSDRQVWRIQLDADHRVKGTTTETP